jgi:endo-1,3(4)-beta-glucanase
MDSQVGRNPHETKPEYTVLLSAFDTTAPQERFKVEPQHPVSKKGLNPAIRYPIPTNKFYANLFLGSQTQGVWLHPYQVWLTPPSDPGRNTGLNVSHVDPEQKVSVGYHQKPELLTPINRYMDRIPVPIQSNTISTL